MEFDKRSNLEIDGHVLRKIYVSDTNPFFKSAIIEAGNRVKQMTPAQKRDAKVKKHVLKRPAAANPKLVWQCHVRWAGLSCRNGCILIRPMAPKLVPKGASPPKESQKDLRDTTLLKAAPRGSFGFGDGATGFRNEAERCGLIYEEVIHGLLQFSATVENPRSSQSSIKGTQKIDREWDILDSYMPRTILSAVKVKGRTKINPQLATYAWSWQWRYNSRKMAEDLLVSLGKVMSELRDAPE